MADELFWRALTAGLGLFIWIPYTAASVGVVGLKSGTTDVPKYSAFPYCEDAVNASS